MCSSGTCVDNLRGQRKRVLGSYFGLALVTGRIGRSRNLEVLASSPADEARTLDFSDQYRRQSRIGVSRICSSMQSDSLFRSTYPA